MAIKKEITKIDDNKDVALEVNPTELENIRSGLERHNVTDERLFSKIDKGLDATKTLMDKFGETVDVADFETQRKYLLMALELRGLVKTKAAVMGIKDGDREIVVMWGEKPSNG
jgi:hypothetical protein